MKCSLLGAHIFQTFGPQIRDRDTVPNLAPEFNLPYRKSTFGTQKWAGLWDCFWCPVLGKKYTILKKWGRDGNILGGVLSGPIFANLGRQFDPTPKSFNPGPQFDRIPNIVNPAVVFDRTPEFANPVEFVDRIPKYMKPGGILTQSQKLEKLGAQLDRIQEFINQGEFLTKQW